MPRCPKCGEEVEAPAGRYEDGKLKITLYICSRGHYFGVRERLAKSRRERLLNLARLFRRGAG